MIKNARIQQSVMEKFPNVELSYEKNLYKKVQHNSDIYLTIPKGRKYFAWLTNYKSSPTCLLLELNKHRNSINSIQIAHSSFNKLLTIGSGTIFYGTLFSLKQSSFFNIENIFYFKGKDISHLNQLNKINTISYILKNHINNVLYTSQNVVFGLPIIETNHNKLLNIIQSLSYDIYCIQHRSLTNNYPFKNEIIIIEKKIYANLLVKPELQNDIYEVFSQGTDDLISQGLMYIPDYKTSVFMNKLFRTIKENDNLDALEESDDEDEFENISPDKFVDMDITYVMNCLYSNKFKYWMPLDITKSPITKVSQISVK
jgi:hypothetical protein